jgi:hypothetical protein
VRPAGPVEVVDRAAEKRLEPHRLGNRRIFDECHRDVVRAGGHGHAHAEPRVHGVARVGRLIEQRLEILAAADRGQVDALAVDRDLDIVRVLESADDVEIRAVQLRLEHVVAVERERIAHRRPADRAERKPVDVLILRQVLADAEGVAAGRDIGIADGNGRNFHRRRDVFLLQRRGHAEYVRDVVEPVRGVVWRQERRDVHVEIEQVVHSVRVFAAVQPMENGSAGIGMGGRLGVEVAFERRLQPPVRCLVRAPRALRRHGAGLELPDHLLPELRLRPGPGDIQPFERQLPRLQALVMAADAVLIQHRATRRRNRGRRSLRPGGFRDDEPGPDHRQCSREQGDFPHKLTLF